jgi:hypothetical protein
MEHGLCVGMTQCAIRVLVYLFVKAFRRLFSWRQTAFRKLAVDAMVQSLAPSS